MKVAIIGATGLLGTALLNKLTAEKKINNKEFQYSLRCLSRHSSLQKKYGQDIEWRYGDITNSIFLKEALKGCDIVFHLAAIVYHSPQYNAQAYAINVEGTQNVVHAARENNVKKLIYVSSCSAIGNPKPYPEIMNENASFITEGNEGYPESKWQAEKIVQEASANGLYTVIVNPSMILGAGDKNGNNALLFSLATKFPIVLAPPGGCSIVAVDDVVEGLLCALKKGKTGEKYILTGENMSYAECIKKIKETITGKKCRVWKMPRIVFIPFFYFLKGIEKIFPENYNMNINSQTIFLVIHYRYYDNTKAKIELAWNPQNKLVEAIRNSYIFYKKEGIL